MLLVFQDAQLRAQCIAAWCLLLLALHLFVRPFRLERTNRLETLSLLALCAVAALQDHVSLNHQMSLGVGIATALIILGVAIVVMVPVVRGLSSSQGKEAEDAERQLELASPSMHDYSLNAPLLK